MTGWGGLIGWLFGCGAAGLLTYDGPWTAVRLHRRLHEAVHGDALHTRMRRPLDLLGTSRVERIEARQLQAGEVPDAATHVLRLCTGAVAGLAVGTMVIAVLAFAGQVRNPFGAVVLLLMASASGWLAADYRFGARIRRRQQTAIVALPAFVESIALAVAAGAALPQALTIVAEHSRTTLATALQSALRESGRSRDAVLQRFADHFPSPTMQRLISALLIALERGTPIAEVLHAQAIDARQDMRRELLENAGRREVAMLVPVIFLVLPAVVVVALYPGLHELTSLTS